MPSDRPILFSGAMVRAILAGTKTQTRRVVKPQPDRHHWECLPSYRLLRTEMVAIDGRSAIKFSHSIAENKGRDDATSWVRCPYGQPRSKLWVRESWQYADWTEDGYPWVRYAADGAKQLLDRSPSDEWSEQWIDIWADLSEDANFAIDNTAADRRWRPSIHMPRWASRITLEVTGVRVERLQDISEADAVAEGLTRTRDGLAWHVEDEMHRATDPRESYASLWESINGAGSWSANPWVWVIEFKRVAGLSLRLQE